MLELSALTAGYHGGTVLHGLDAEVPAGAVHAVVGHNGAGKTTLVHAVAGLLRPGSGTVRLDGTDVTGWPPHRVARAGIGLVPQGRRVFGSLTVAEHLLLAHRPRRRVSAPGGEWSVGRVLDLLPRLGERRGHRGAELSGGEQQMLALARALLGSPRVLLLDEPTEGLAPGLTRQVHALVGTLAAEGLAVLLVSPSPESAAACADTVTVLASGRVTARFDGAEVRADQAALHEALAPAPLPAGS
ncbi:MULTISPECIES: ABC transporter ATP-binding protein [unclassified Streptomyces]|uniref:ABC transporter ATP-binding protein n=1 Tax=unclassified Streptomyces TaxID=2593676 RepID=UPI0022B6DEB4|nr:MULTISPECIES: ABC transporter ATP-binding protein [unclassified Streptomyces]MCZ7416535.1 ABC transporter ATP-binding protein [Streptomyces sp. WMMC897]MCZ7433654.1 ABC transporter ATP-binding protein [Streptomyces sp. WMMC1477]